MIDQPGPRPTETRDRNLSRVIARIRDDGPALSDAGEALGLWSQGLGTPPKVEVPGVAPLIWEDTSVYSPADHLGSRSSTPEAAVSQTSLAQSADERPSIQAGSALRLGRLLPGALVASSVLALGVVGVLYLAPAQAPSIGIASAEEPALHSQLAALQGTITALSERIESLKTGVESGQVEALGERLDRMSRQVADLARDDRLPADLDRRLEAITQGLDTTALRVERLFARGEGPPGIELAAEGMGNGAVLAPPPRAAVGGQGKPAIGVAELQTDPPPGGGAAADRGLEPWGMLGNRLLEVADSVLPPAPSLVQGGPLGDHPASVGSPSGGIGSKDGSTAAEAPATGSVPLAESLTAELHSPEPLLAEPLLAQDKAVAPLPPEEASAPTDLAEYSPPSAGDEAEPLGLVAPSEPGEPALVDAAAPVEEATGKPRLRPKGAGGGTRGAQSIRQRVAMAAKGHSKGPASTDVTSIRRPPPRVVDDLF